MRRADQQGSTGLIIALAITGFFLLGSLAFGFWAFSGQQNYKNNTDEIVNKEVKIAVDKNSTAKDNEFSELLKSPVKTYTGPSQYGSIILQFPKSWSAYVATSDSNQPIDGYFNPGFVPGL